MTVRPVAPVVGARATAADRVRPAVRPAHGQRCLDLVVATVLLVALAPLMIAIAVLVRATSSGPVLYRQTRVGAHGRTFTMLKFRTMYEGAEWALPTLLDLNEASGPLFKLRRDPRTTAVGRVLRRLSLDELPQLLNVLAGTMSLVGPRPALPHEVERLTPDELRRHLVRPGITGLAQVRGRSCLDWSESIRLDLHYVEHRSLRLDLLILVRTVAAVVTMRGAF